MPQTSSKRKKHKEGWRAGQYIQPKKVTTEVPGGAPIKRGLDKMMSTEKEGLWNLFNMTYIARKGWVNLQVLNGAEFHLYLYVNKEVCKDFIQNVADFLFNEEITIEKSFEEHGLSEIIEKKTVFTGSEGASVNNRKDSGPAKLFQNNFPYVSFDWFFSHQLEWSLHDALRAYMDTRHIFNASILLIWKVFKENTWVENFVWWAAKGSLSNWWEGY